MDLDVGRLRKLAPFGLPLMIAVGAWFFLISPTASENARAGRELDALQQRLAQVRASVGEPPPPAASGDPVAAFERQVAARDASSQVVGELAALAGAAAATNLVIETGERAAVAGSGGPQVDGGAVPDPRFSLFPAPLAYTPIVMSFDAAFARVGDLIWDLRDLATITEIRALEVTPATGAPGRVHVTLTVFAYARQDAVLTAGASR